MSQVVQRVLDDVAQLPNLFLIHLLFSEFQFGCLVLKLSVYDSIDINLDSALIPLRSGSAVAGKRRFDLVWR